jgi:hypothetical protein
MLSSYQTNDNKIICFNYQNALGTLKEKLYNGDYYTSTQSLVCIAYNRRIHRYQVFSSQDSSIPMNENPRSKENYDSIRILDISTSSDDFEKYIESQIELSKLNNNLSDGITDYNEEEQRREIRKELIDSIIYIQTLGVGEKEAAYFEYDDGNSEISKRCISTIKEEYEEQLDHEPRMSVENLQHMLSEQDIPNEVAKELAILILEDRISVVHICLH